MSPSGKASPDPDTIYFNGIDPDTGQYAMPPVRIDDLVKRVRARPGGAAVTMLRANAPSFAIPFGVDMTQLADMGWAVVFAEGAAQPVRDALAPLIEHRRQQAGGLLKVLDYKKGEQVGDWYRRHQIAAANLVPELVPYYLLLVGGPAEIPFEFQYLLGVEYAVGRLSFEQPGDYERYVRSLIDYESAGAVANARKVVYWGTCHLGDGATELSSTLLLDPLANGMPDAAGALKRPIHEQVGYGRSLFAADEATRANLLGALHADRPPALLFTASHGMAVRPGKPNQVADQGGLICQDWPGFGAVAAGHRLSAAEVTDDARVGGLVAFLFACFGAGTPDADQFLMDLGDAGTAPPPAPRPFVAALPRRLLAHPRGGALAVIGHVDRAWGFSIRPPKTKGPQIRPFRDCLGFILDGSPLGHSLALQFGQRYAALSTALLTALSPTTPAAMRPGDRDLVNYWLERNDAQNYVLLGDPAARVRKDDMR